MSHAAEIGQPGEPFIDSGNDMTATTLRDRVVAARISRGMTPTALQRQTGLSARTIRDIEAGHPGRRYGATTLARLDEAFGWAPGSAWDAWKAEVDGGDVEAVAAMRQAIAEQMAALEERLARMEETPPWAAELVNACRLLSAEDRARVLDLAHRLGPR